MKNLIILIGLSVALLSCSPFKITSDFDAKTDFNQYKTYTLNLTELHLNDIDKNRVIETLEGLLGMKNIHPAKNPSMEIKIKAYHKTVQNSYITPNIHIGGLHRWIGLGVNLGRTFYTQSNQGTLILEFYDTQTGKMLWQGYGSGINLDNPQIKQQQIPKITTEIIKHFPPKK